MIHMRHYPPQRGVTRAEPFYRAGHGRRGWALLAGLLALGLAAQALARAPGRGPKPNVFRSSREEPKSTGQYQVRMGSMSVSPSLGFMAGLGRLPNSFKISTDFDISVNGPLHVEFGVGFGFSPATEEYAVGEALSYYRAHPELGNHCESDGRCWIWDGDFLGSSFNLQLAAGIKYKFLNLSVPLVPYLRVGLATDFLFTGDDYFLFGIGPRFGPGLKYMVTPQIGLGLDIMFTLEWAVVASDYADSGFAGSVDFLAGADFLF